MLYDTIRELAELEAKCSFSDEAWPALRPKWKRLLHWHNYGGTIPPGRLHVKRTQ